MAGSDLLSHRVTPAVPSALEGLTSEFGMGSGGTPPLSPPTKNWCKKIRVYRDGVIVVSIVFERNK